MNLLSLVLSQKKSQKSPIKVLSKQKYPRCDRHSRPIVFATRKIGFFFLLFRYTRSLGDASCSKRGRKTLQGSTNICSHLLDNNYKAMSSLISFVTLKVFNKTNVSPLLPLPSCSPTAVRSTPRREFGRSS